MNSYPKVVQRIHNEYNTAGETLLSQAQEIINNTNLNLDKANRLEKVGFKKSNELKDLNNVRLSKETADLVMYYQQNYPNSKFITDLQVEIINNKYNLVCAPVDCYTGFVPDVKLKLIEDFKVLRTDKRVPVIKVKKWSFDHQREGHREIESKYPGLLIPISECHLGDSACIRAEKSGELCFIKSYERADFNTFLICAPQKEMKLTGLKKLGAIFTSFATVTIPDPVVLQPVKGGYLIVCAWGDEASDPIVVNEKMN